MNKVGIIGAGNSAKNFIKALNKSSKFKLCEIGSRNLISSKKISKIYKTKINVKSINEVINSKETDLVIVCLPGFIQPKIIKKLILKKKNIICEKPFSINYSEVKKLRKVMRNQNKIFLVNFCYNFLHPFKIVLNQIKKNTLKLEKLNISWNVLSKYPKDKKHWKNNDKLTGGVLYNYGSHILNLFFPKKKKIVIKIKNLNIPFHKCNFSIKDNIDYNFSFSNIAKPPHGLIFELIGKKGRIKISNLKSSGPTSGYKLFTEIYSRNRSKIKKIYLSNKKRAKLYNLYLETLNYYLKIKKNNKKNYINNFDHASWNTYLLEKIQKKIQKFC